MQPTFPSKRPEILGGCVGCPPLNVALVAIQGELRLSSVWSLIADRAPIVIIASAYLRRCILAVSKLTLVRSADTSPEIHDRLIARTRAMTPSERLLEYCQLCDDAMEITADGIRHRHPDYDDESVEWAFRRLRYGDDLFREAWPDGPLLDW